MYTNDIIKIDIVQQINRIGWKVFPVHCMEDNGVCSCGDPNCGSPGKHPLTANGVKDATGDANTLKLWFSGAYEIANIGMATGEVSGVAVLDVDGEDGQKKLKELEEECGSLPATVTQKTGSGIGRQYFFAYDERWSGKKNSVKFATGLDTRVDGGYAVLPPSNHKSGGRYEWINSPFDTALAVAPDWLLDLIPDREEKIETPKSVKVERARTTIDRVVLYLEKTPPAISGQRGHDTTYNVCCRLIELFPEVSDSDLLSSMEDWNNRCSPPWSEKDLNRKIDQARKKVGSVSGVRSANPNTDESDSIPDSYPKLDLAAYHGISGEILRTLDPVTEADPASLLLTFLSSFGVAVGRKPFFAVEGTRHHANINVVLVGQSSKARKGTSLGRIKEIMAEIVCPHISGLSTGEGLIFRLADDDNDKKPKDKRLLVVESEFARCLSAMKRDGNTLSAVLRDTWDTGELSVVTRNNSLSAKDCHVGIVSHITEEELSNSLRAVDTTNGFGNRFLWGCVKRSKLLPEGGSIDMSELRKKITEIHATASEIEKLERSPEAKELWRKVYPVLGCEKSGLWDSMTSRAEAQVVRLSLIYALLDCSSTIEVTHLRAALAVWEYCDRSARRLFEDPESNTCRILATVRQQPGIKKSELLKIVAGHGKNSQTKAKATLSALILRGEIIEVQVFEGRQATTLYPGLRSTLTESLIPDTDDSEESIPIPVSTPVPGTVTPATLSELFEWRNLNGVAFEKREGGEVWVTQEHLSKLTPAIEEAIRRNQQIVATFVTAVDPIPTPEPVTRNPVPEDDIPITDVAFFEELQALNRKAD